MIEASHDSMIIRRNAMSRILGICPHCQGYIYWGEYGAYCSKRCGISLNYAYGQRLSELQIERLLSWQSTLVRGLRINGQGTCNAYLLPVSIESYSYPDKFGRQREGYHFRYEVEIT